MDSQIIDVFFPALQFQLFYAFVTLIRCTWHKILNRNTWNVLYRFQATAPKFLHFLRIRTERLVLQIEIENTFSYATLYHVHDSETKGMN